MIHYVGNSQRGIILRDDGAVFSVPYDETVNYVKQLKEGDILPYDALVIGLQLKEYLFYLGL